jgi:hypothetical protein
MGRKVRSYSRVSEASELIEQLCEKHADAFWCVTPAAIAVMGIDNVTRTDKAKKKTPLWSKLRHVKGVERAIFDENEIKEKQIIEVFWDEWNSWSNRVRCAVLARHMFEINGEPESKNSPDCVGFKILFDVLGVNWEHDIAKIPDLLNDDIQFNLDLRPGLDTEDDDEDGDE